MHIAIKFLTFLGLTVLLATCGRLPSGAPIAEQVTKQSGNENVDFSVYPVTRAFLPTVAQWPSTGAQERLSWIGKSTGARTQIIQPGDMLDIQIWDSSDNSLLTAAEQRTATLGEVEVASNGSIFVPYVGDISVIGLTPDLARKELQSSLEAIVPSAQVQLAMTEGPNNSVDLVGGVGQPGTYAMPDRNFSVLGLLAQGGGVKEGLNNAQIRLMRGNSIYGTSVDNLLDSPSRDTLLRGGDRVFIEEDERYFLSFGAAGKEAVNIFTKDHMSAMDAVAVMGGINDSKADPEGLLIIREYSPSAVQPGVRGPRQTRVVFTINLTSTDGLFSARKFQINPEDLVVATESPVNDALTISNIIGNIFGVFNATGAI
jgi:polysaccharide biosynthesis/export protein